MYTLPILELLQDSDEPPATPESIEELELELGVRFPKEYADFLLQFNGGDFRRPVMFYLPQPTAWIDEVNVDSFFGDPGDREIGDAIATFARLLEGSIPDDCLPIAHCGGDIILLTVAGPAGDFGKVWFWDEAGETDGDNVHWVANSFAEFLSMLQYDIKNDGEEERETVPVFQAIERGNLRAVEQFLADGRAGVAQRTGPHPAHGRRDLLLAQDRSAAAPARGRPERSR